MLPHELDQLAHDAYQLLHTHQLDQAEQLCNTILQHDASNADVLHCLGLIHFQRGQFDQAVIAFTHALELRQESGLYSNLGLALTKLNLHHEALDCYSAAIALEPGNANALYNQGNTLQRLNRLEDALQSYDHALAITPTYAQAWSNRGNVLRTLKRWQDALNSYDQAIALQPDHPVMLNNRGVVLMELHRPQEALQDYAQALALAPDYTEALYNKGNALLALGQITAAQESLDQAVASDPENADAHFNRAMALLLAGNLEEGWREYEWRWKQASYKPLHHFKQPRWTGQENLNGKTLLLHAEQGAGDTLQFLRYIPLVKALGAHVILEIQAPLKPLLHGLEHVDRLIAQGEALPRFDYHCLLMSLPAAFNTDLATIPPCYPVLSVAKEKVTAWKTRLGNAPFPKIGLAWSGNPDHKNDHHRSIPLAFLLQRLAPEFSYISLQQELREQDRSALEAASNLLPIGEHLQDFSDTAALIANLDLVISVDTSVAHLAGIMGKPVWILLPYAPDWRWLEKGEASPWYPSARLFRQPAIADWDSAIAQLNQSLRNLFADKAR
jgi:tetratricopeptide (TPR) repeat protein